MKKRITCPVKNSWCLLLISFVFSFTTKAAIIDTVETWSASMKKNIKALAILLVTLVAIVLIGIMTLSNFAESLGDSYRQLG